MPKKGKKRSRRGLSSAGAITLQYAAADNVAGYTFIDLNCSTLGVPTDRPTRVNWVKVQFSACADGEPESASFVPILQYEVRAPLGTSTDKQRILYRSPPMLVPLGPIKNMRIRVPNAGFFQYEEKNAVVLRMIIAPSKNIAVTFNVFVNISIDFKSYQGFQYHPPGKGLHSKRDRSPSPGAGMSSEFSSLSLAC